MAEKKSFGADLRIAGFGVFTTDDGTPDATVKLALSRLETDQIEGSLGDLNYRADQLSLDGVQAAVSRGQTTAEAGDLTGFVATSQSGHMTVTSPRISFPRGLMLTRNQELFAPHLSVEDAHFVIDLGALSTTGAADADADRSRMDWRFLDTLEGQLDLDLVVDMTLPWIGQRRVTHYFRVPIENGTIDYEKLEQDVHWLEAAFLTLDVVDDKLVLARDLPLVPYSGKALLEWPLEQADIPVASFSRVHLRNLLRWQLPADAKDVRPKKDKPRKDKPRKERSKIALHALAMENIKLALTTVRPAQVALPGGAILQFGDDQQAGLINLNMSGEVRYESAGQTSPTALSGHIDLVDVTVKDLALGAAHLSIDRLHIGEVDKLELTFDGFRPRKLELAISRVAATNVRVTLG